MNRVIVDTGFLISLFRPADRLRTPAREFLRDYTYKLATVSPVIVETCFFLDPDGKARLIEWIQRGAVSITDVPVPAYAGLRKLIRKYADQDIDFVDAALIWFAEKTGDRSILTVDVRDFSVFRLSKGKRFDLVKWFES